MADEKLKQEIEAYVDEVWEDVIADMDKLVAIESVQDLTQTGPGMPWGPEPARALECALELAADKGLEPTNCKGYIGFADLPGEREDYLATIAHVDIVPLGTGWAFDPLAVTRKDGYLIGRGVIDDKGPWVLSLYACKFFADRVRETGEKLPYTLRCMVGCNEETNMHDVEWYLENYPEPAFLFTPDAEFPLCYGEKGTYWGTITSADLGVDRRIVEIHGGHVRNAVPSLAEATVRAKASQLPAAERIEVVEAGSGMARITAHGIEGHASKPAGTINAILLLTDYLLENGICNKEERAFLEMEHQLLSTTDGSGVGIQSSDDYFDPTTLIGGTIYRKGNRIIQTVDSRFVTTITADEITAKLGEFCGRFGASYDANEGAVPYVTDPTSAPIQTLIGVYNEMTGKDAEPFTMGGGTYARHFARAASFGPNDPELETPEWVHGEHSADEGISEQQMKDALKIYILAIHRLMQLEL